MRCKIALECRTLYKSKQERIDFPASDLAILVQFETEEDYKAYFSHPFHIEAAQFVIRVSEPGKVAGITYEDVLS